MKKKLIYYGQFAALLSILFLLFRFPTSSANGIKHGLILWFGNILPSVFLFAVICDLFLALGYASIISRHLAPVFSFLFGLSENAVFPYFVGLVGGFPLAAKTCSELRCGGKISKTEGDVLISFSSNASPIFLLLFVGISVFSSTSLGCFLIAIQAISSLATGLIFSRLIKPIPPQKSFSRQKNSQKTFLQHFPKSIQSTSEVMLTLAGYICFFTAILFMLKASNQISHLAFAVSKMLRFFGGNLPSPQIEAVIFGLVELTNGIFAVAALDLDISIKITTICFLVNFSGLSVIFQGLNFILQSDISIFCFVAGKFVQAVFSSFLCYFLLPKTKILADLNMLTNPVFAPSRQSNLPYFFAALVIFTAAASCICLLKISKIKHKF